MLSRTNALLFAGVSIHLIVAAFAIAIGLAAGTEVLFGVEGLTQAGKLVFIAGTANCLGAVALIAYKPSRWRRFGLLVVETLACVAAFIWLSLDISLISVVTLFIAALMSLQGTPSRILK